jgi:hypothetical protein
MKAYQISLFWTIIPAILTFIIFKIKN